MFQMPGTMMIQVSIATPGIRYSQKRFEGLPGMRDIAVSSGCLALLVFVFIRHFQTVECARLLGHERRRVTAREGETDHTPSFAYWKKGRGKNRMLLDDDA